MEDLFFEIFQDLPRQGPGSDSSTRRALELITELPQNPRILDLGCGSGAQTMQLAHFLGGSIYALDKHKPYLETLNQNALKLGYGEFIETVYGDMHELEFDTGFFDLIWAEGSIYILGFEEGLGYLKKFLKTEGYCAVTEVSWLKNNPPDDLKTFWEREYSGINSITHNIKVIPEQGYELIDYFILSPDTWWKNYYTPLENRIAHLRRKYVENEQALELIESVQLEIDVYRKFADFYSYVFYICRNV